MKQKLLVAFILVLVGMFSQSSLADTVTVTSNTSSGIKNANYTATLADGTVLGFYNSGSTLDEYYIFCGAISSSKHIIVPDQVTFDSVTLGVTQIGDYGYRDQTLDLTQSPATTELTFGESITYINARIPDNIESIHFNSPTPPGIPDTYGGQPYISSNTVIWCPESAYYSYRAETLDTESNWYNLLVRHEGWTPNKVTVNVNVAGSFANEILKSIDQWNEVDELVVTGHLNEEDTKYFSRLSDLSMLDLSGTDIDFIAGCKDLSYLSQVILPSSATVVKDYAFSGCIRLKDFDFSQITEIGQEGFSGCTVLTNIDAPNLTTIGTRCFNSCTKLTSFKAPQLTKIPFSAFKNCSSLSSFDFSNITYLGLYSFSHCTNLKTVNAVNLKDVEDEYPRSDGIFYNCTSLTDVTLGNAISVIPSGMFYNCGSLTNIEIPQSVKHIGDNAFSGCPLTEINFPEGILTLGNNIINSNTSSITKVNIPSTIESIKSNTFNGCESLTDLYCYALTPPAETGLSSTKAGTVNLHVPALALTSYKLSDTWFEFAQILPITDEINQLNINGDFTIYDYTGVASDVNLRLTAAGHLTVAAGSQLSLNDYIQYHTESDFDYSTLIAYNEIRANNVTTKVTLPTGRWSFLSFPYDVNVSDIVVPDGTLWVVRKYNGANRASMSGDTWENITSGQILEAGQGYIFHCINENENDNDGEYGYSSASNIEFEFPAINNSNKNNIFSCDDVVRTIQEYPAEYSHNRGWNLTGNPYPSFMNIQHIDFAAPITVWNGSGYTAYSLVDDEYLLHPNEAFFVQCPVNSNEIKFLKDGRTHGETASSGSNNLRTKMQQSTDRTILNFILDGENYSDRTRLVLNENALKEYEIECDASKFMSSDKTVPQIYIVDNGIRYAIDERPLGTGEYSLGMRIGKNGNYNISLNSLNSEYDVMLVDNQTDATTDLNKGSYSFDAETRTDDNRFTVKIKAKEIQSEVADVMTETVGFSVSGNKLYVSPDVKISLYTIDGKLVHDGVVNGSVELTSGIYILSAGNASHKIAIK